MSQLRSQTLGNVELEKKVLRLFVHQLAECIDRIRRAETVTQRSEAAHTLVGAARGVVPFAGDAGQLGVDRPVFLPLFLGGDRPRGRRRLPRAGAGGHGG
ncbi:MAG: hypothetical protein J0H08_06365 [Rhizobiales bacterium]|nr:hypothetical protein [Hyphomicrobiales bacterium]